MPSICLQLPIHLRDGHPLAARGLERYIPDASILHTHDDRSILEHGEMNPIAGLEICSRSNALRNSRLALAGHRRRCHC
jgi:hypothetical protein